MKTAQLFLSVSLVLGFFVSANAQTKSDRNSTQVEISGQSARELFFALEKSGAEMGTHTARITEYTLGNLYCYADTDVSTKESDFSCTITVGR